MTVDEFKKLYYSAFYYPTFERWRVNNEKAGKDIVGEQYEHFRKVYYAKLGFEIGNGKKLFGSSYNCDVVVKKNGKIVLVEEDKGSYVDSCFLGRAINNAAQLYSKCVAQGIEVPYFVISSSTRYNKFKEIYKENVEIIREDLVEILNEKLIYFPLCEHDRVNQKKYFMTKDNCFNLSDELITEELKFIEGLL